MAIDVLSDPHSVPIIVGDDAEMSDLQAVGADDEGRFHLLMNGHKVMLSEPASANFRAAKHLLLVGLAKEKITRARKVRIDNLDDGCDLSADQREALTKALSLDAGRSSREFYTAALAEFQTKHPELASV